MLVAPALTRGTRTDWDFSPYLNGNSIYARSHPDMYELQHRSRLEV